MKGWVLRSVGLAAITMAAVLSLSCARNHDLDFIEVTPQTETLGIACSGPLPTDCAPTTNFRAIGHYIHPQNDRDITSEVTWSTSNPDLIAFADPSQPNVLFPTGLGCGTNLTVQATSKSDPGNVKIGTATVNVNCGGGGSGTGTSTDFTLAANQSSMNVAAAGSATYTIEVTAVSGTPAVDLAVNTSNLPPQVASFTLTPGTVTTPGNATLTLKASQTTGTGTVQIIGSDTSGVAVLNLTLTVQ